jgi:uncharacterized phage protein (TIGR01671 family)
MRKDKYRAWEKNLKEIIPVFDIDFKNRMINTKSAWRTFDEVVLMQSTGRNDKKGIEIYEYDIVKVKYFQSEYIGRVVFNEITCGFEIWYSTVEGAYGEKATHKISFASDIDIEVIGNMYNIPECLKRYF